MARFFQTAPTQFVQDFIYQPPWELIQKATAQKQQEYDTMLAQSKLFDNLNIQHLNGEDDIYNVQEKQRYYREKADQIAQAIKKDPANANKYMANIEALGKELQQDMTTGDISKIQGSYAAYEKWQKDNEQMKKDNPARYQAAANYYMGQYAKNGGNSINRQYSGDLVTKDVDWEKLQNSVKDIKANEWVQQSAGPGGGYIYKNKRTQEEVTADRIDAVIFGKLLSDPSNMAALRQSQQYGLGTYFNEEGFLDQDASGFAGLKAYNRGMAYQKIGQEQDVTSDGTYIAHLADARAKEKLAWEKQKFQLEEAGKNARSAGEREAAKDLAYQTAIINATAEGDNLKAAELSRLYGQAKGVEGSTTSNTGSRYSDLQDAASKAKYDRHAKKLVESILPTALKEAGLNYKIPDQAKIAKEVTDKVILGKLRLDEVGDYLDKAIPNLKGPLTKGDKEKIEIRANSRYKRALEPIKSEINDIQSKIDMEKKMLNSYDKNLAYNQPGQEKSKQTVIQRSKDKINTLQQELNSKKKQLNNIDLNNFLKEETQEYVPTKKDLNTGFRDTMKDRFEEGINKANKTFTEKREFSTHYEVSPSDAVGSTTIANYFTDPNFRKEFSVEIVDQKTGKSKWENLGDLNQLNLVRYEGMVKSGPLGPSMFVFTNKEGRKFNITSNQMDTPQAKLIMNTAYRTMTNPKSQLAYLEETIPEAYRISNAMQALKLKGQTSGKIPMQFRDSTNKLKDFIIEYNSAGNVTIINPNVNEKTPGYSKTYSNHIEAGKYLQGELK